MPFISRSSGFAFPISMQNTAGKAGEARRGMIVGAMDGGSASALVWTGASTGLRDGIDLTARWVWRHMLKSGHTRNG